MNKRLLLASPHMSDEGYELEYINDAFRNTTGKTEILRFLPDTIVITVTGSIIGFRHNGQRRIPCRQSRSLVWTPLE